MGNWYEPQPKQKPIRLPRRLPIKTVPSGLGDKGIVGNWLFYYLKGGDYLHDFSPEGNHGTLKNDPAWKDGRYGWALDFDGGDDYVEVPDDSSLRPDKITVSVWVNLDTKEDWDTVLEKRDYDAYQGYFLAMNNESPRKWLFRIGDGSSRAGAVSTTSVQTDTWTHLVGVFDGTQVIIYVNGTQEDTADISSIEHDTRSLWIGGDKDYGQYIDGTIAIIRIYLVAKSSSWISRRFARTKSIFSV